MRITQTQAQISLTAIALVAALGLTAMKSVNEGFDGGEDGIRQSTGITRLTGIDELYEKAGNGNTTKDVIDRIAEGSAGPRQTLD